jgi:predicted SnoaL-like aldol condensation-catalyzing enzyme
MNTSAFDRLNLLVRRTSLVLACLVPTLASAQLAVVAQPNHEILLADTDARLATNKRFVYDFWREVFEGGHMELADKYMAETYIQHNPNVATGRAPFVEFFSRRVKPQPIEARVKAPLVAITADGDLVILSFVREGVDPKDPSKKYTTTWFDMFRIESGKIAEHWDPAPKL